MRQGQKQVFTTVLKVLLIWTNSSLKSEQMNLSSVMSGSAGLLECKRFYIFLKGSLSQKGIKRELSWVLSVTELGNVETELKKIHSLKPLLCLLAFNSHLDASQELKHLITFPVKILPLLCCTTLYVYLHLIIMFLPSVFTSFSSIFPLKLKGICNLKLESICIGGNHYPSGHSMGEGGLPNACPYYYLSLIK